MITRRLNYNDLVIIENLINERWSQVKKRRNSTHNSILIDRIKKYLKLSIDIENKIDVGGLCQVLGSFDNNNNLIAFCTQKFWNELPVHYLGNMTTKPGISNLYNVGIMGLGECWEYAVKFAEDRNYFKWYWITEVRGWDKRENEWYNNCSAFRRYHVFIDSMYNKGEKGKYNYQNTMLGEYGANTQVAIKYAILKPFYLHNIHKEKGYLKSEFVPIQYKEEDRLMYKQVLDFKEIFESTKNELNMLVDKEYYKQYFPDIAKGKHIHFGAYDNNKLIGTSSMIKFFDSKKNRFKVYHLWSWTHPKYRRKKIWTNLMKCKANYINKHNWCEDNNTNVVATSFYDQRYANIGWTFAYDVNKIYKGKHVSKKVWYILWEDMKKCFNIL